MGRPAKLELDEVMKRATDLFWEKGGDAVTTRDLEEALDLRAPAIYRRFRSKEELFARCVHYYVDNVIEKRLRWTFEDAEDPMRALRLFFLSTLEPHGREPRLRGCLLANTATHADGQNPEVRSAIVRGWTLIDTAFREQIERGQQAGQLDKKLDPEAVSQSLLMSLQGLLTLVRAGFTELRPGIDATFSLLRGGQAA